MKSKILERLQEMQSLFDESNRLKNRVKTCEDELKKSFSADFETMFRARMKLLLARRQLFEYFQYRYHTYYKIPYIFFGIKIRRPFIWLNH